MQLVPRCLKVDRPNAKAMLLGFWREGKLRRQSIWLAVMDRPFPALLTLQRAPTRFKLSRIGEAMAPEDFTMPLKYVAELDCEYFIRNEMALWETVCSNGLFDIWMPDQPYLRFAQAKSDPAKFRIQLLRIYEIERGFSMPDIEHASPRIDHLLSPAREVEIKRPVISDGEFDALKDLLEHSVASYLLRPPRQTSTSTSGPRSMTDAVVDKDIESLKFEEEYFEGERTPRLSSFYERNPQLRAAAVRRHGTVCEVCGFDFGKVYGTRGEGFIEVHHLTPVSSLTGSRHVDPLHEMIVVCSNCHRMIHRKRDDILTPDQLKEIITLGSGS